MSKILIATPTYDGKLHVEYVVSLMNALGHLRNQGHVVLINSPKGSLLTDQRMSCVAGFLASDCDYLMFIDSDIIFEQDSINRLLSYDLPIVAAPYSLKMPRKNNKPHLCIRINDYDEESDQDKKIPPVFHPKYPQLMKVRYIGTGFLLIHRSVFDKMKNQFPELKTTYLGAHRNRPKAFHDNYYRFFDTLVTENGFYLGEDYSFCHLAAKAEYEIWADMKLSLKHIGTFYYH